MAMFKFEFGEKAIGEPKPYKVDCAPDVPSEINYSTNFNCTYEDPLVLDEISYKPVVCKALFLLILCIIAICIQFTVKHLFFEGLSFCPNSGVHRDATIKS